MEAGEVRDDMGRPSERRGSRGEDYETVRTRPKDAGDVERVQDLPGSITGLVRDPGITVEEAARGSGETESEDFRPPGEALRTGAPAVAFTHEKGAARRLRRGKEEKGGVYQAKSESERE